MKKPEECGSYSDVIEQIDLIDHNIISLIAKRAEFIRIRPKFKPDKSSEKNNYLKKMLEIRRDWAEQYRLDPDQIESIFTSLVGFFNSPDAHSPAEARKEDHGTSLDPTSLL